MLIGERASDAQLDGNVVLDSCRGVQLGASGTRHAQNIAIRFTIFDLVSAQNDPTCTTYSGSRIGHGVNILDGRGVDIRNNMFLDIEDTALKLGVSSDLTPDIQDIDFFNNIVQTSTSGASWIDTVGTLVVGEPPPPLA